MSHFLDDENEMDVRIPMVLGLLPQILSIPYF